MNCKLTIEQICTITESPLFDRKSARIDAKTLAIHLIAFANADGGVIAVGVEDDGTITGIDAYQEHINELLRVPFDYCKPSVQIETELLACTNKDGKPDHILLIEVLQSNELHANQADDVFFRVGDKSKKLNFDERLHLMYAKGTRYFEDTPVPDAAMEDIDLDFVREYTQKLGYRKSPEEYLRENKEFISTKGGKEEVSTAAMLLFGKYTQRWLPVMTAKCISFVGNHIGGKQFRDKVNDADMEGNLLHQFETIMAFFTRNLKNVQVEKEFNSLGRLEIPYSSLVEFVVNALVHRSLNWNAPIRIFIFDNRVEIHSPGILPNGLQVEDITNGTSMPRNNFLFSNAIYLLPYTGAGTGIQRALEDGLQVEFKNDERIHEFLITIKRNPNLEADSDTILSRNEATPDTIPGKNETTPDTFDVTPDTRPGKNEATPDTFGVTPDTRRMKLTPKQKDVVNYCNVPRSSREILERAGVSYHSKNIQTYITDLVEAGYLERTIPERPSDMNQKYRKK